MMKCLRAEISAARQQKNRASSRTVKCTGGAAARVVLAGWLVLLGNAALAQSTVALAWDPSASGNIAGYNIYYGVVSQTYTNVVACGNVTTATISNLVSGTTYYFAATALNTSGLESAFSTEISATMAGGTYQGVNLNDPSQALADPDGDGRSSLMEYALGTSPSNPSDDQQGLTVSMAPAPGGPYLSMQYKRRKNIVGLQYVPEVSSDKQNWLSDTGHVEEVSVTSLDSQFDWVTAEDLTAVTASAPQLIRLKVIFGTDVTTSEPLIGTATRLAGNGGVGVKDTLFSQRLITPLGYAGTISQLGVGTLSDTNAGWTNNQFNGTNGAFYVELTNGWMVDITNTDAGSQTLGLAGDVRAVIAAGTPYVVRKHFTVGSLFGPTNQTGLAAGLNPSGADNIFLVIPQTQQTMTIFYYSGGAGTQGWYRADYSPAGDQVVYPEQGLMVRRKTSGDLLMSLAGPVKTRQTIAPVSPGYNLLGTLEAVTNLTLGQLNLYTGDPTTGVASGLNPSSGDNLLLVQPGGAMATYFYYKDSAGNQGWLDAAYNSAQSVPVPAGSAFFLERKPPYSAFNWIIPAE